MFKYRYSKRVWMTLVALFMLMACATGETPPQPTRITEQDTNQVEITSTVKNVNGVTIVSTLYDDPNTAWNIDMICQTSLWNGNLVLSCQKLH